jgi:hypothetical protein
LPPEINKLINLTELELIGSPLTRVDDSHSSSEQGKGFSKHLSTIAGALAKALTKKK